MNSATKEVTSLPVELNRLSLEELEATDYEFKALHPGPEVGDSHLCDDDCVRFP